MGGGISTETTVKWYQTVTNDHGRASCCGKEFDTDYWEYWNSNYNLAVKFGDCDFYSPCSSDLAPQEERILNFIDKNLSGNVAVAYHDQFFSDSPYISTPSYLCHIYIFENEELVAEGMGIEIAEVAPCPSELSVIQAFLSNCYEKAVDNLGDPISPLESPAKYEQSLGRYEQSMSEETLPPVAAFYHSAIDYTEDLVDLKPWRIR